MSSLVNSYITYKTKRAEIKQRQRQELGLELDPYLKVVGQEILKAQSNGKRIEDVEFEIGVKNRALVYRAKRLANAVESPTHTPTPELPVSSPEPRWRVVEGRMEDETPIFWCYIDERSVGSVTMDDEGIVIPEYWALDMDNSKVYGQIIRHIRDLT